MKRSLRYASASLTLLVGSTAFAGDLMDLPNYDAYQDAPVVTGLPSAAARFRNGTLGRVSGIDEKRGVPTFFWAPRDSAQVPLGLSAERAARVYLERHAILYGASSNAVDAAEVVRVHDTGRGGIVVVFRQKVGGIELARSEVKVVMTRDHRLVAIGGSLHPSATKGAKRGLGFKLTKESAIAKAFGDLYQVKVSGAAFSATKEKSGGFDHYEMHPTKEISDKHLALTGALRVKSVFYPMPDKLVPAYWVEILAGDDRETTSDAFSYIVAADDGRLLHRQNLTERAAFQYRVWSDGAPNFTPPDGPQVDYAPHPAGMPNGSSPDFVSPTLVTMDGFNTNPMGTFDPWLVAGATSTNGNNVDAYTDWKNPDGIGGGDFRANVTAPGVFDRIYDINQTPDASNNQAMAAITQIFFVNNFLHDYWYDSGFNEAAGNAQANNFGRGGAGGDVLHAEAQDSYKANPVQYDNANMSTPADGQSPRMQMYVWHGPSPRSLTVTPLGANYATGIADFGLQVFNVTAGLQVADDGSTVDSNGGNTGTVADACQPIVGGANGKILVAERGSCTFVVKQQNAQAAGAVGLILANNTPGSGPMGMTGASNVNTPMLSISFEDGLALKAAIMAGQQSATMTRQAATVDRDGTIDNGVVAHEWGHYIHHRLVNCGSTQCGGQSEGWGDFNALHMLVRPNDDLNGTFASAIYAGATFGDSAYFGIRRYPYSTDMTKNALTFKHISNGEALPTGMPSQGAAPDNAEVHNAGEIWATMMFEAYLSILQATKGANPRYTFDQAKRVMADYVVLGMQAAPADPTYTEQRDGIMAAAAASEPLDFVAMGAAFAKRGAGTCAVSPARDSQDLVGVTEDFEARPDGALVDVVIDDSVKSCDNDGVLDNGEIGKVNVILRNSGWAALAGATATVSSTNPNVSFPNGAMITFPSIDAFTNGTAGIDIALADSVSAMTDIDLKIDFTIPGACTPTFSTSGVYKVQYDNVPMSSATESFESDLKAPWTTTNASGPSDVWTLIRPDAMSSNRLYHAPDLAGIHDERLTTPPLTVGNGNLTLSFKHRHEFESDQTADWDGAVIEYSTDDGMTWADVSALGNPGYGGTIGTMGSGNPLNGRNGYVATNASWPNTDTVTIDLGNTLAGQAVRFRFREGMDEFVGAYGWEIDDITFQGLADTPFASVVDDQGMCAPNSPPVALAGPDQTVTSGTVVTLDATGSSDPDNDPLTFSWLQKAGPAATLSAAGAATTTFTAPNVAASTVLTFEVTVSDGKLSATDTVDIIVAPATGAGGGGSGGAGGEGAGVGGAGAGGSTDPNADGDCGCSVPGSDEAPTRTGWGALLALGASILGARRRRTGKSN